MAPAAQGLPHALQKKVAPGAGGAGAVAADCGEIPACPCDGPESAQTSAMIQPMNVQPARRFSSKTPVKLGLFRARNAGRKYKNKETSQNIGWK